MQFIQQNGYWLIPFVILDLVLKGFALWKSAQAKRTYWFIALLVVNSLGILPGIYLLFFQPKPLLKKIRK